MNINEISYHERCGMRTRRMFGYDQYDDHVWRWLNYHLAIWGSEHRVRIALDEAKDVMHEALPQTMQQLKGSKS